VGTATAAEAASTEKRKRRGPKPLGPATVGKPVLVGAALLAAVNYVLPKVL
jgi:hypothetical protein